MKYLLSLFFLALAGNAMAQQIDQPKLDRYFDRLAEKSKAMGSMLIAKDGKAIYERAFGFAQVSETDRRPNTTHTRFRIGSITKMFTGVMIFQLAEEGKLKLTDHLDRFFPQLPNAAKITIEQVLGHRSGIHDVTEDAAARNWRTTGISKDEMLAVLASSTPDFDPGAKYSYSNSGFFVLACIVEKVTGDTYENVLRKRITGKLGLNDTYPATGAVDPAKNESYSYKFLGGWTTGAETHYSVAFGAGSLISTPADLLRFSNALFGGTLLSKASLAHMMTGKLALDTFDFGGKTFYGHNGGIDGFGSWLAYLPGEQLTLAYTTNAKVYPVTNIMDDVLAIYWNKPFTIPAFAAIEVSTETLDRYTGTYSSASAPVKFTISRKDNTLFIKPNSQASAVPLEATAQDKFRIEGAGMAMEFDAAKGEMLLKRNGRETVFTKEK